jgi:nucleoside-diphosphate-sugar epimerase
MMKRVFITGGSGFIGTNLIELIEKCDYEICNFDKVKPLNQKQEKYWYKGNLLEKNNIEGAIDKFKPNVVIHLAARTDTLSDLLEDYIDNTKGTKNLVQVLEKSDDIERVVITSTQYVYKSQSKPFPDNGEDYKPYTVYGQSKVITEEHIRNSKIDCTWAIVRPSNIWGPWHIRYPNELWKMIDKGLYIHPSKKPVIRTYGYVGNIAHQIHEIIKADKSIIHKKTFYLGDNPIDSYKWLNTISVVLRKKKIRRVTSKLFVLPALGGDILNALKIPFPLYTRRFKNMIEDYYTPTNVTVEQFGVANANMKENVEETVRWIETDGKQFSDYWKNKK